MTICIGLAVVNFIGGLANFLEIAYPATLNAIVVIGVIAGFTAVSADARRGPLRTQAGLPAVWPGALLIAAVFVFQTRYLAPPAAFNIHDDFETYLSLPLRMLQTGTLKPGMFSNFGVTTLGAQPYLQGFVAAHWPLAYVDMVDATFGLLLTALLILMIGRQAGLSAWLTALAVTVVISLNPQYANVSALYLGSALLVFILFVPFGRREDGSSFEPISARAGIVFGLFYATLMTLKSTFVLAAFSHFTLAAIAVFVATRKFRSVAIWTGCVVASACFGLLPWILNQTYKLVPAILARDSVDGRLVTFTETTVPRDALDLLSTDTYVYGFGTSYAHYTAVVAATLLCAALLALRAYRGHLHDPRIALGIAGCLTLPVFYALHMTIIGGVIMGYDTALRYAAPVFIATAPAALVLAGSQLGVDNRSGTYLGAERSLTTAALGLIATSIVWFFSGSLINRSRQAIEHHTLLSYLPFVTSAEKQGYLDYNRMAFASYTRDRMWKIQRLVPAGETILSYVSLSVHYDFSRNPIWNVDAGGLSSPLLGFPLHGSVDDATRALRGLGVNYILWQYRGYAVHSERDFRKMLSAGAPVDRSNTRIRMGFNRLLTGLSERSEILYDDSSYRLIRLSEADSQ